MPDTAAHELRMETSAHEFNIGHLIKGFRQAPPFIQLYIHSCMSDALFSSELLSLLRLLCMRFMDTYGRRTY